MTTAPTFDHGFTCPGIEAVFSADARVRRMVQVEVALAEAQAELELIPAAAAAAIAAAAAELDLDGAAILAEGWTSGSPVIPLLDRFRAALSQGDRAWLHHQATTQDIVDSALMVQIGEGVDVLVSLVARSIEALSARFDASRDEPAMARTLMQPALPTTWGQRIDDWRSSLARTVGEVACCERPAQLGGPIGDRRNLPDDLVTAFAERLGLTAPAWAWHTDRWPVTAAVDALADLVRTADKIAGDLILLAQPEIGEATMRAGGSSAMAHKQNPIDAIHCRAAAQAFAGTASIVTRAPAHELQRAAGSWQAEWFAVPVAFHTAGAALEALANAVESLTIVAHSP